MNEQEMHWAFYLINKPYTDGTDGVSTDGPDAFNCWGLVRWCFINIFGIPMPVIRVGASEESRSDAIRQVEEATGWRRAPDAAPRDLDIALMWGPHGRHVGLVLQVNGGTHLLHAVEGAGVTLTRFSELWMLCMKDVTLWRRA